MVNTFGFENKETKDVLMITQLPPLTLMLNTEEGLANEFVEKFKTKIPKLKIIEQGNFETENIDGYKMLLDVSQDGKMELIYITVFSSNKSVFVFQGIGVKKDEETKNGYKEFLSNLEFKN